ncbi:MAG: hypothetical protein EA423_12420 [Phycisphaerales bacterium]|nr:MAG: hypothetical protein EA423_12420 [Phycisphaerales bacterium]
MYKGEKSFTTLAAGDKAWLIELRDMRLHEVLALKNSSKGNYNNRSWAKHHVSDPLTGKRAVRPVQCLEIDCKDGGTFQTCRFIRRDEGPGAVTWFFAEHKKSKANAYNFNYRKIAGTPASWSV